MDKQDRREFIKIAGKALLVTSSVTVFGLTSAKPKAGSEESQDEYYSDGYYDDGYYDDGYATGLGGVNERDNLKLAALPNPSNGNFELVINAKAFELSKILISDLSGKVVLHKEFSLTPGENRISFKSDSFARGIYELTVAGEKSRAMLRIIIAK